MTDATQDQERLRLADDPDEPEVFIADRPEERVGRAVACRPIPAATTAAPEAKSIGKRKPKQGPRMQYSSVDVPVPLRGANCAAMPPELVEKYFNADVLRQAAASQVAKVVCAHCPIIETCFNRALNGGTVRRSGVIAGMGARELQRGRLWLRYERGTARRVPSSQRPEWLPQNDASGRFQQPETATTDTQS